MPHPSLDLLHRIAADIGGEALVEIGTMFRSPGLRTGKKIVAFLGHEDVLIVKLPKARADALTDSGATEHVTMGQRTMREWVEIPAGTDDEETLQTWTPLAHEALAYVRSLPG